MSNFTDEQLAKGRARFLAVQPEVKRRIEALTEAHADALGITLEHLRESETMRELREFARAKGLDSIELFWSCVADTAEEFAEIMERHNEAVKKNLGL
jgi:hypothetical protein